MADELAGDHDAARRVQLSLPETGVCSGGDGPAVRAGDLRRGHHRR